MKAIKLIAAATLININVAAYSQIIGSFTDVRDNKTYKTIRIGNYTFMAENLAFKLDKGCWTYNDNEKNASTYGYLYNIESAQVTCPFGWHLPSQT